MQCPQCHLEISHPGKACPACHANLTLACPQCMFRNLVGQQFCGSCNKDLQAQETDGLETMTHSPLQDNQLKIYPVLSIELMHLDKLQEALGNYEQVTRLTRDIMARMESQLLGQNATIESIRDNVMFCSFKEGITLGELVSRALKVGITLSRKTIQLQEVQLQMRVGLDLVSHSERGPMSGVPERLVAKAGQIVASQAVYQATNRQIPYDTIGPIKVQGQLRNFYRIMTELQKSTKPAAAPVPEVAAPSVTETHYGDEPTPQLSEIPVPAVKEMPVAETLPPMTFERRIEPMEKPAVFQYEPPQYLMALPDPRIGNIQYNPAIEILTQEIAALQGVKGRSGKVISLAGRSGSGKSTLINMVRNQLPEDAFYWVGGNFLACYDQGQFPLYTWLELIQNTLVGLPLQPLPPAESIQHLETVLKTVMGAQLTPELFSALRNFLSLTPLTPISSETRQGMGQLVPHLVTLLHTMTQGRPVVMVLENLEYADPASLDLLVQLLQKDLLHAPIALILTHPPDLAFTGPLQKALALHQHQELVLQPLDEATLITMVETPLAVPWKKLPDTLRNQLQEKGTPLFLEEAFRWLQMEGGFSIHPKSGKFNPEKPLKQLRVPENLHDVILDRFEKQEEVCRFMLQVASVLGERFSTEVLNLLVSELAELPAPFQDIMNYLWQSGFITPDTPQMARFRHQTLWETVIRTVDQPLLQKYHHLAAKALEKQLEDGLCLNPHVLARHYAFAGQMPESATYWEQAAVWLAQTGSTTGANLSFNALWQALSANGVPIAPETQRHFYTSLGLVNMDSTPEFAKNLFLTALHAPADDDIQTQEELLQLQLYLAQTYEQQGNYPHAVSTLHRALLSLPPRAFPLERIALGSEEMWFLYLQGKYEEAMGVYARELKPLLDNHKIDPWEDPILRQSYFKAELAHARIALMQCHADVAFEVLDKALTHAEGHNEDLMSLMLRMTRGWGYLLKGHYEGCQRELDPLLSQIERLGTPPQAMAWWGLVVMMYHADLGDWQNASMLIPNISYQAERCKDYLAWCMCQAQAARLALANGNTTEAHKLLDETVTVSSEYYLSQTALIGWRLIAETDLGLGQLDKALDICLRAIDVALKPQNQNRYEYLQLTLTQARILMAQNTLKEAGTLLEKHWPELIQSGYTPLIAEAAWLISELYGKLSQNLPEPHREKYRGQQENFRQKAKTLWQEHGNQYRLAPLYQEQDLSLA